MDDYTPLDPGEFHAPDMVDNGGIYLLERGEYETRAPISRERFAADPRGGFADYRRDMPTSTTLRTNRSKRHIMEKADWDGRPAGFREDDGPRASAFTPPHDLRPPRGGIRTPTMNSYRDSYSEAINRRDNPNPNSTGLLPAPEKYAVAPDAGGSSSPPDPTVDPQTLKIISQAITIGFQAARAVMVFILIALMGMLLVKVFQIDCRIKNLSMLFHEYAFDTKD